MLATKWRWVYLGWYRQRKCLVAPAFQVSWSDSLCCGLITIQCAVFLSPIGYRTLGRTYAGCGSQIRYSKTVPYKRWNQPMADSLSAGMNFALSSTEFLNNEIRPILRLKIIELIKLPVTLKYKPSKRRRAVVGYERSNSDLFLLSGICKRSLSCAGSLLHDCCGTGKPSFSPWRFSSAFVFGELYSRIFEEGLTQFLWMLILLIFS